MMSWKSSKKFGFKDTSLISRSIVADLAQKAKGGNLAAPAVAVEVFVKEEVSARVEVAATKVAVVAEISAKNHRGDTKSNYP